MTLLEYFEQSDQISKRSQWVFTLLQSILEEDGMSATGIGIDVLGDYEAVYPGGSGSSSGGLPDTKQQQALARKWIKFREDYVRIKKIAD